MVFIPLIVLILTLILLIIYYFKAPSHLNKLELTFHNLPDAIITVDTNRRILILNKAAEKLFNISASQATGQFVDQIITLLNSNDHPLLISAYCPANSALTTDVIYSANRLKVTRAEGKHSFVDLQTSHFKDSKGNVLGWVLSFKDVTSQKETERLKLDFVAMTAHELRTPLTAIIGYLATLNDEAKSKLDQNEQIFLDRSLISAQQLNTLIDNLLNTSKIERKALYLSRHSVNWEQNLKNMMESFHSLAQEKNINITLEIEHQPIPFVFADLVEVNEVLNNLVDNAITYSHPGGKVEIKTRVEGDQVVTSIKDYGIGIAKEIIPNLFTKFYRATNTLESSGTSKGTGLGLYVSKAIIDSHGGKIWVNSEIGMGSTFSFSLPFAK